MTTPSTVLPTGEGLQRHRAKAAAQQDAVVTAAAPRAVVACPGAGKTRTIVNRHCATPRNQPIGRAITSFTKVAAAQIRARAHELGRPDLLQHPHAIMTLDGFFWRFLVRPFLPPPEDANRPPFRRLESWRNAPRQLRQIDYLPDPTNPRQRHTFDLAEFQFRYPGQLAAPIATLTGRARSEGGRRHLSDEQIATVCRLAEQQRTRLANDYRLFTGEETRRAADRNLANHAHLLGQTLPARFSELIVDEAQDCSDVDVNLLLAIQELGLPTLVIADPDQAIYGFRSPGPPAINRLLDHMSTVELTGNWRSSSTVCRLAATMRADPRRRTPDTALADHHDAELPIHLIPLDGGKELSTFDDVATRAGIPPTRRLVLAHAAATLPGVGADPRRPPANPTSALAWAVAMLRQAAPDQRTRALAEQILQAGLVRYWMPDADYIAATDRHNTYGIDPYHLRRLAAHALDELPDLSLPAGEWCAAARRILSTLRPSPDSATPAGTTLTCPPGKSTKTAASLAGVPTTAVAEQTVRTDTVHQVKGEEADAVLMLLPDDGRTNHLLTTWTADAITAPAGAGPAPHEAAEALRVLYVAVTRARRLAALALPAQHITAIAQFLTSRHVPTNVTT
ncbi:UvrD-helicase domain-containing protein [Micromonospora sp. RV43]|uniref:UvrD-helicase domain-containing protein n=1 Tax=Micromonospora sp. RV43 TaxID=1661387 RepID=UPI000ABCFB80|nr:UvrD-helicase domain-containing protein [Micromonospora sp. RV43]